MVRNSPFKIPFSSTPFKSPFQAAPGMSVQSMMPVLNGSVDKNFGTPEMKLPRVLQYAADTSGCGFWRMLWPEHALNATQKALVTTTTIMNSSEAFYAPLKAVKIQRQASKEQLEFFKYVKSLQSKYNFRLIYEIDDVVFHEDIPDYNRYKFAFESAETRNTIIEIIGLCDEVTVTNKYMRDYFRKKTGKNEISVIPNFPPRWWIDAYGDPRLNYNRLLNHKKKPRILYSGAGAHFDVDNKANQKDDFEDINKYIIDTRHKYTWIFIGAAPNALIPYIRAKQIEFHPWQSLYNYPRMIQQLEPQMLIAPLQDNEFNRCKSDIKFIEACCLGLPIACQDVITYENAPIKFKTGAEMIDRIEETLKKTNRYLERSHQYRKIGADRYLENDHNLDCHVELLTTPYGSNERVNLRKYN